MRSLNVRQRLHRTAATYGLLSLAIISHTLVYLALLTAHLSNELSLLLATCCMAVSILWSRESTGAIHYERVLACPWITLAATTLGALIIDGLAAAVQVALVGCPLLLVTYPVMPRMMNATRAALAAARARRAYQSGDLAFALKHFQVAESLLPPKSRARANLLSNLADVLLQMGNLEAAKTWCSKAVQLNEELVNLDGLAQCHRVRGELLVSLGQTQAALTSFIEAARLCPEDDVLGRAHILRRRGRLYVHEGRLSSAAADFALASELYKKAGDYLGQAYCLRDKGQVLVLQGRYNQAAEQFSEAFTLASQRNNPIAQAGIVRAQASLLHAQAQFAEARALCCQAIELYRRSGHSLGIANVCLLQAQVLLDMGSSLEAVSTLKKAIALFEGRDPIYQAYSRILLGDAWNADGELSKAHEQWQIAVDMLKKEADRCGDANVRLLLGELLKRLGSCSGAGERSSSLSGADAPEAHSPGPAEHCGWPGETLLAGCVLKNLQPASEPHLPSFRWCARRGKAIELRL